MKILITGGRGFLASHLINHLADQQVAALSRTSKPIPGCAHVFTEFEQAADFTPDVLINLAGASLFAKRWNPARQAEIYQSRVHYTERLLAILASKQALPTTILSGSAVGYYGDQGSRAITETNNAGKDWSAKLCADWESVALAYADQTRVCIVRTGLVMHPSGGAMQPLMLPAKAGLLGPFGKGDNFWPWIALQDWLNAVSFLIEQPTCQGPFNLSAPNPDTQKSFMRQLSQGLKRPSFLPIPSPAVNIMMGTERAELLMASQKMLPTRLLDAGFEFLYTDAKSMIEAYVR